MSFDEILEYVIAQTGHEPYRDLVAETHPESEGYRRLVRERYDVLTGAASYPPVMTQLANAAAAATRVVTSVVMGQPIWVSTEEAARRQSICDPCPHWQATDKKCLLCGCNQMKLKMATESCPDNPPKW